MDRRDADRELVAQRAPRILHLEQVQPRRQGLVEAQIDLAAGAEARLEVAVPINTYAGQEQSEEILEELGFSEDERRRPREEGVV